MKISGNEAVSSNDISRTETENSFKIKATGKAFRILSDNLYGDKVGSVIREIGCNAVDAHAMNKNNVPFEVHVPTDKEPWFSIRDFGPGMSNEDVMTIYTTYFESTKTQSDDFIGAYGLGGKSPFSITNSFAVTSIHAGMKRSYTMFIDEYDLPRVSMIVEELTQEPSGMLVSVPVNGFSMINDFQRKIPQIYQYFDPKPTIISDTVYIPTLPEIFVEDEKYSVYKKQLASTGPVVLLGNVSYRIAEKIIEDNNESMRLFQQFGHVLFRFKVGELDVSASRETLAYTEKTRRTLTERFKYANDHFKNELQQYVSSCKTFYQASCKAVDLGRFNSEHSSDYNYSMNSLVRSYNLDFKGKPIVRTMNLPIHKDGQQCLVKRSGESKIRTYKGSPHNYVQFDLTGNEVLVHVDDNPIKENILRQKIRSYGQDNGFNVYALVMDKKDFNKVVDLLGYPPVENSSNIVRPKIEREKGAKQKIFCAPITRSISKYTVEKIDFDPNASCVYVERSKGLKTFKFEDREKTEYNLDRATGFLRKHGFLDKDAKVLLATAAQAKKMNKKKCKEVFALAREKALELVKDANVEGIVKSRESADFVREVLSQNGVSAIKYLIQNIKLVFENPDCKIKTYSLQTTLPKLEEVEKFDKYAVTMTDEENKVIDVLEFLRAVYAYDVKMNWKDPLKQEVETFLTFLEKYPLLNLEIRGMYGTLDLGIVPHYVDYVNLIESRAKK